MISRKENKLLVDGCSLEKVANEVGTPTYVYSKNGIEQQWLSFDRAFGNQPHLVCYAVKTNSNLAVLSLLARLGAGFDIVSGGELSRVLKAGGDASRVVFSGVGKSVDEIRYALLSGIKCFNVESQAELYRIERVAQELKMQAPISVRVNPNVDPQTHAYISTGLKENKFGVNFDQAMQMYRHAADSQFLSVVGVDCHIGSQLLNLSPLQEAAAKVLEFCDRLHEQGIEIKHIDLGGGLGIEYQDTDQAPTPEAYVSALVEAVGCTKTEIIIEPGRSIVGNQGILLSRVEYLKENEGKSFVVIDAAMNDLIRPALYDAWQAIEPVDASLSREMKLVDVVGPVCETGDFLGKDRQLGLAEGDLVAILSSGAYGFVMSSNYNSRARAAEVMVDGNSYTVVRQRETIEDLMRGESIL